MRREQQVGLPLGRDDDRPLAELQGRLDRLGQPRGRTGSAPALSRSITTSMLCLIWRSSDRSSARRDDLAVDPRPDVAGAGEILEQVLVLPLLAADHGGQDEVGGAGGQSSRIRATICSRVWAATGRSHFGQCPWPTLANSTRR